jgi:microcin C transport system permease protein
LLTLDPGIARKLKRFKRIKRGYFSFLGLVFLIGLSGFAELLVNNRALVVSYGGEIYFPTYGDIIPARVFGKTGFEGDGEVNYRQLALELEAASGEAEKGFVILPLIPYSPLEIDVNAHEVQGARPPSLERRHLLGTDTHGRDILARIVYGFRMAIFFSIAILIAEWGIGISLGCLMGYRGGWFDSIMQRLVEVFDSVPLLYVIIIVSSIIVPNVYALGAILVIFGWMGMANTIRAMTYREKSRDYVLAARGLGAGHFRVLIKHIVPNMIAILVTSFPFALLSGMNSLTALDYLGFGLPPPTPSWGELLKQGTQNLQYPWITYSVTGVIVLVMTMATFFGEAIREAFDPKQHTTYE